MFLLFIKFVVLVLKFGVGRELVDQVWLQFSRSCLVLVRRFLETINLECPLDNSGICAIVL